MSEPPAAAARGIPPIAVSSASTRDNRTGSWRYIRPEYHDLVAPCNAGCPVGIDIEGYMHLLGEGRTAEAVDLLLRENPIPAITGRVCDHPCESVCNRTHLDEAVAVHGVERTLGDRILEGVVESPFPRSRSERVAVVGSGPAGLACAYHLARAGYPVTVFEAAVEAGGMLRLGIPAYRLPRDVLDRQIEWLEELGIEIRCGVRVGMDVGWREVASFDAVFVAVGAHGSRSAGFDGEDHPAVIRGLDFLRRVNRGERPRIGARVAVVGGGNTAMDCARTARRLGADVVVVYRRGREEMPAIAEEVEAAEREGVRFVFLAAPEAARIDVDHLRGLECRPMTLGEPDASGRRRPVPSDERPFSVTADTVLTAIGEVPVLDFLPEGLGKDGVGLETDELGRTAVPRVFGGGDAAGDERTVAHALGAGKRAAVAIDRHLRSGDGSARGNGDLAALRFATGNVSMARVRGEDPIPRAAPVNRVVRWDEMNPAHFASLPRFRDALWPGEPEHSHFEEVNLGLGYAAVLGEARRCLACGVCNRCELCVIFCPDAAISRAGDGEGFVIDLEHCKGCGLCAAECPRGAIAMVEERV